jgi:inosine-uridine nucleoside N-ribohydrolase
MAPDPARRERPAVLIDCDPGHDDVLAIGVATRHCEILGITSVAGNSPIENTTRNALIATELFGLGHVPVHRGSDGPIDGSPGRFAFDAHGRTGLDGPEPRSPERTIASEDAVGFIIETVRANEGVWLVPVGPLTNIAKVLRAAPDVANRISGISLMGGSVSAGNVTSAAEFNIWFDPVAAAEVFSFGVPIKMSGLDVTAQVLGDGRFRDALLGGGTDTTQFCGELMRFFQAHTARLAGKAGVEGDSVGAPLFDTCAVLAITHPELFETERLHVVVETMGEHTRGMTLADRRWWADPSKGNVDVLMKADGPTATAIILEALLSF